MLKAFLRGGGRNGKFLKCALLEAGEILETAYFKSHTVQRKTRPEKSKLSDHFVTLGKEKSGMDGYPLN